MERGFFVVVERVMDCGRGELDAALFGAESEGETREEGFEEGGYWGCHLDDEAEDSSVISWLCDGVEDKRDRFRKGSEK